MRVLLDECIDRRIAPAIVGHEVVTVPQAGWAGIDNGRLIELAATHFDAFITIDRTLPQQQRIEGTDLATILLQAPSNRAADLLPLMPQILGALDDCPPGEVRVVGGRM